MEGEIKRGVEEEIKKEIEEEKKDYKLVPYTLLALFVLGVINIFKIQPLVGSNFLLFFLVLDVFDFVFLIILFLFLLSKINSLHHRQLFVALFMTFIIGGIKTPGAVEGIVLDAESKEPLSNMVVYRYKWFEDMGGLIQQKVITNKDGDFKFLDPFDFRIPMFPQGEYFFMVNTGLSGDYIPQIKEQDSYVFREDFREFIVSESPGYETMVDINLKRAPFVNEILIKKIKNLR